MRFVAGRGRRGRVAGRGAVAELLAGALWQSCWPGLRGGVTAERRRRGRDAGGSVAEIHWEETAARELHREDAADCGRLSL